MMNKQEMQAFRELFSKYCRQEINKGHCESDGCEFCSVNSAYGEFIPFHPDIHNLMAYYRSGDKDILIIANYQKDARTIMLSREPKQILLNNYDKFSLSNLELNLLGYQALVLEL